MCLTMCISAKMDSGKALVTKWQERVQNGQVYKRSHEGGKRERVETIAICAKMNPGHAITKHACRETISICAKIVREHDCAKRERVETIAICAKRVTKCTSLQKGAMKVGLTMCISVRLGTGKALVAK